MQPNGTGRKRITRGLDLNLPFPCFSPLLLRPCSNRTWRLPRRCSRGDMSIFLSRRQGSASRRTNESELHRQCPRTHRQQQQHQPLLFRCNALQHGPHKGSSPLHLYVRPFVATIMIAHWLIPWRSRRSCPSGGTGLRTSVHPDWTGLREQKRNLSPLDLRIQAEKPTIRAKPRGPNNARQPASCCIESKVFSQ